MCGGVVRHSRHRRHRAKESPTGRSQVTGARAQCAPDVNNLLRRLSLRTTWRVLPSSCCLDLGADVDATGAAARGLGGGGALSRGRTSGGHSLRIFLSVDVAEFYALKRVSKLCT